MRTDWIAIAVTVCPCAVACGAGDDDVVPVPVADAAVADGGRGTSDAASADAGATPSSSRAFVRVANWSPDSPAIDLCVAPHGTLAFTGPITADLAASTDAGPGDVAFPFVSAYVSVPAAVQYDAWVVVAGADSCAVGILPDAATPLPALAANAFATMALVGEAHPSGGDSALQVVGFLDDTLAPSAVTLRVVDAVPSWPEADVRLGTKTEFFGVAFGTASTKAEAQAALAADASAPSVDSNGYLTLSTLANATITAQLHGATQPEGSATEPDGSPGEPTSVSTTTPVSAASGSALTVVLVGGTSSGIPPSLVECVDNAGTAGSLSNCSTLP
jgi:hypothetical protein